MRFGHYLRTEIVTIIPTQQYMLLWLIYRSYNLYG